MFSEYQFHTSGDAGDNLCVWVKNLLEIEKPMGKVISIQIPMRSSPKGFQVPNHQVFVYVKGNTTPKAAGLGRQHFLPLHQRNPVKCTGQPMEIQTSATTARAKATSWVSVFFAYQRSAPSARLRVIFSLNVIVFLKETSKLLRATI